MSGGISRRYEALFPSVTPMDESIIAVRITINGIVQGVGFRPFVYQSAREFAVRGHVANTSFGVLIHAEGESADIDSFFQHLKTRKPPLAHITDISRKPDTAQGFEDFTILPSTPGEETATLISPDMSVCDDCLRELFDPADRRYRYPFINCTHCGPRYTIIDDIPYDRPYTSMSVFPLCDQCRAEYEDPGNRRFHAQPNACPVCGPQVALFDRDAEPVPAQDPIRKTIELLKAGHILAIKGLGGFHLAADAENPDAVGRLRERKGREEKPFALMAPSLAHIQRFARTTPDEERLLTSPQRPIVLFQKKKDQILADSVAPRNRYFGVMLPYTPLHYLLFGSEPSLFSALVMTSANLSEEPIAIDNDEAFRRLAGIADFFLVHNRDIRLRSDDSITRIIAGAPRPIRRSRGYAPMPIFLKNPVDPILACGAALKSAVCLTEGKNAFMSQHIGDLENLETEAFFRLTVDHLKRILDIRPEIIAHDLHPDYLSTQYALAQTDLVRIPVQHHHAHIAACLAENRIEGPVIGLAFDGTGFGGDGAIWGGEVLITENHKFTRAAHLSYVGMPGSAAAIKEPERMAVSYLLDAYGENFRDLEIPFLQQMESQKADMLVQMIDRGINTPKTSSLGRLFDGIAALAGLRSRVTFEGQAAMELEMIADRNARGIYAYEWTSGSRKEISTRPLIQGIVEDLRSGVSSAVISGRFHNTLIRLFTQLCREIRTETGLDRVALSGGSFQNAILLEGLIRSLSDEKFNVFTHTRVPANDGGVALGQAWVAAARTRG
ncbi:MAG: carbamoyltransferase HypF [Desulfococcaceae bacterium]